jgi:protoporphyrinogen oxidase
MNSQTVPFLIIGAGPAGLAAAYTLLKAGQPVVLLEPGKSCGGFMKNLRRGEFNVDLGRKELYTRISQVKALWTEVLEGDFKAYDYRVGMLYGGYVLEKSSAYRGFRRGMPLSMFISCAFDFLLSIGKPGQPANFEEFSYKTRGRLFCRIFSQGFYERFNGYKWSDLPAPAKKNEVAGRKDQGIFRSLLKFFLDKGDERTGEETWQHPVNGSGQITEALEKKIRSLGAEIHLECAIQSIETEGKRLRRVSVLKNGMEMCFEPGVVISSLPLETHGALLLGRPPLSKGQATTSFNRGTLLVYLFLEEPPQFPHVWLNVSSPDMNIGRITSYANFGGRMVPPGKTCLCIEFFLPSDHFLFSTEDEQVKALALRECSPYHLFNPDKIFDSLVLKFPGADAAVSWDDYLKDPARGVLFQQIRQFSNLYNVNRPGTDRATHAGLSAAKCALENQKDKFEFWTNPLLERPWEQTWS